MTNGTNEFVSSVYINLVLALLIATIFSYARNKVPWCYAPRLDPTKRLSGPEPPQLHAGLFGWVYDAFTPTDEQILESAGLDAYLLVRFLTYLCRLFLFCGLVAIIVLLPINVTGGNGQTGFDSISIANITQESTRLWAHTLLAYAFYLTTLVVMHNFWKEYVYRRHQYLRKQQMAGENLSILVHDVPSAYKEDFAFKSFFQKLYPGNVKAANLTRNVAKLEAAVNKRDYFVVKLENAYAQYQITGERPVHSTRGCCQKVDAIDYFTGKVRRYNDKVKALQETEMTPLRSGFVTFYTSFASTIGAQVEHNAEPFRFITKPAPEPRDVYWPALGMTRRKRNTRYILINLAVFALVFFWIIPVSFVSSLTNLDTISQKLPWFGHLVSQSPVIKGFLQGFLPSVAYLIFMLILPMILLYMSQLEGIEAHSWLQMAVLEKYFIFQIFNFFLVSVIANGIFAVVGEIIDHPTEIVSLLGTSLPTAATQFTSYILLRALTVYPIQLLRLDALFLGVLFKTLFVKTKRDLREAEAPPQCNYGAIYPELLLCFVIAVTYATISPIVVPFATVYFGVAYMVLRYQVLYVYVKKFESGGLFWPLVFDRMIVGLIVSQLTLIGLMGIKEVPAEAAMLVPLPFVTIAFYIHCHRAFTRKSAFLPLDQATATDEEKTLLRKRSSDKTDEKEWAEVEISQDSYIHPAILAPATVTVDPEQILAPWIQSRPINSEIEEAAAMKKPLLEDDPPPL